MARSMFDRAVDFAKRHLGEDDDYQTAQWELINSDVFGPWLTEGWSDEDGLYEYTMAIIRRAEQELYE